MMPNVCVEPEALDIFTLVSGQKDLVEQLQERIETIEELQAEFRGVVIEFIQLVQNVIIPGVVGIQTTLESIENQEEGDVL